MATLTKNDTLIFYSPVTLLGGENDVQSVISILASFALVVISKHTGADLVNLQSIRDAVKKIAPATLWFGYTSLGAAANYAAWKAAMQQWGTDMPSPFAIDGIFIDQAGPDYVLSTRANLNQAITDVRAEAVTGHSCFVNAFQPHLAFGNVAGAAASIIGNTATRDYALLESYWQSNLTLALEDPRRRVSRAEYLQWMQTNLTTFSGVATLGASTLTTIDPGLWQSVRDELHSYGIDHLGIGPSDYGSTSHTYFLTNVANTTDPYIPGIVGAGADYATVASMLQYLSNVDMSAMGTGATLTAAQQVSVRNSTSTVDRFCRRVFQAASKQRKVYNGNGKKALKVDDLLSVSSITETDLAGNVTVTDLTKVLLRPLNAGGGLNAAAGGSVIGGGPYTWLEKAQVTLNPNPDLVTPAIWTQGQSNVEIEGVFGYGQSVPADVVQAASMLAAAEVLMRLGGDQALTHGASSILQGVARYEFAPPRGRGSAIWGAYAADVERLIEQARRLLWPYRRAVLAY